MRIGGALYALLALAACGTSTQSATEDGGAASGADGGLADVASSDVVDSAASSADGPADAGGDSPGADAATCGTVVITDSFENGLTHWNVANSTPASIVYDTAFGRTDQDSLRVDFRQTCSCTNGDGRNCYSNLPQVTNAFSFDLKTYYVSWWVYYPADFTFYDGPCPGPNANPMGGHFVRLSSRHTPHSPNDSYYYDGIPDFGLAHASSGMRLYPAWQGYYDDDTDGASSYAFGRYEYGPDMPSSMLAGQWNHYEIYADLGTPGGYDGVYTYSVDDQIGYAMYGDTIHVGTAPSSSTDGPLAAEAAAHPGLLRVDPQNFSVVGLVSNPNSAFGGRPGDVYWIDDVSISSCCPRDRPLCANVP
ncbi:MAG TPA: hypothetical protein VIY73_06855 [Polyangiaceae bacterium]